MSSRRHDWNEDDLDPDAPATAEEIAGAARLRDALVAASGRHAGLPDDVHARLLAAALGPAAEQPASPLPVDDAMPGHDPASPRERRDAERLRERVAAGLRRDPDAEPDDPVEGLVDVAAALRHANDPAPLDEVAAARALARASLGRARGGASRRAPRAAVGLALAAAAAAAIALLPRAGILGGGADATAGLVPARSTQELFDRAAPFPREGGQSDRIDRIATSRRGDLRQNRFAGWGIR